MKKLTLVLISLLLVSLLFTSCGKTPAEDANPDRVENQDGTVLPEKEPYGEEIPEEPEQPEASEEKDETVLFTADASYEIEYTIDGTGFTLFKIPTGEWSANYGIIDMEGNVVVEPTYTTMGWCPWHNVVYAEPFLEGTEPIYLDDTHKIDLHYGHGGAGSSEFIYSTADGKFYVGSGMYGEINISEWGEEIPEFTPYLITDVAVEPGFFYTVEDSSALPEYLLDKNHSYAFVNDRGAEISMGLLNYVQSSFVNDYMPVQRDGKWGYISILGEEVTDFIYDGATNAYDGKAWVKQNGAWTVISLG